MTEGESIRSRRSGAIGRDPDFEVALGGRIRAARVAAGMTQRALGDAVGISYQKLQKYELGMDRIAVSTLRRIARALGLHPGSFFDDGVPTPSTSAPGLNGTHTLPDLLGRVRDPRVVKQIVALIEELGGDETHRVDAAEPPVTTPVAKRRGRPLAAAPTQAVIDPLLKLLTGAGTTDAGALAKLLGRALAEAGKILKEPTRP